MQQLKNHLKTEIARNLPSILGKPLQLIPFSLKKQLVTLVLERIFQDAMISGDLDFLKNYLIRFEIEDCGLQWTYTYNGQSLEMVDIDQADAIIRCKMRDFVQLANRRVDPDTLFFQRRLIIEGDTELGLTMKNLMDALDPASLPIPVVKGLQVMEYLLDT